jgi:hypothetical protein
LTLAPYRLNVVDYRMPRKKTLTNLPPEVLAFFSAASARRRRVDTACQVCGAPLPHVLPTRRYCSPRCRQRAYLQRKAQPPTG